MVRYLKPNTNIRDRLKKPAYPYKYTYITIRKKQKKELNTRERWQWGMEQLRTVLSVAVIDISVAERGPPILIPANPNGHHLTHLPEHVEELPFVYAGVQIPHIQRQVRVHRLRRRRLRSHHGSQRSRNRRCHWYLRKINSKKRRFDK